MGVAHPLLTYKRTRYPSRNRLRRMVGGTCGEFGLGIPIRQTNASVEKATLWHANVARTSRRANGKA